MRVFFISAVLLFSASSFAMFSAPKTEKEWKTVLAQFEPVPFHADYSKLSDADRKVLQKLVQASDLLQEIYMRQVWSGYADLRASLATKKNQLASLQLHFLDQNAGPWSNLNEEAPFIPGVKKRPLGGGFYPEDMKKAEFEKWVKTLSPAEQAQALGCFTVVRREKGKLTQVPYHQAYAQWVVPAAKLLEEAAQLTTNASLKKFLSLRAKALLNDDYFESDVAWLALDSGIDVTFGPYETYDDKLFGYKASYESFIGLVDEEHSKQLGVISNELQYLEDNLPMPDQFKNKSLGKTSPIRIVNLVYSGGDARGGVMTAAFNLPNDEKVITQHGSKKIMLKNVQQAKFAKILEPLAKLAVGEKEASLLDFDAFFTHILAHELSHGIGPHELMRDGKKTTVRQELKELYSAIEEAKADILGVYTLEKLLEKGVVPAKLKQTLHATYLASAFRSVRFGIEEAHGRGQALQFNYLWDKGGIAYDKKTGKFSIVADKISPAVKSLATEILMLQAEGSYPKAKAMLSTYAKERPEMKAILAKAKVLPVDVEPIYQIP